MRLVLWAESVNRFTLLAAVGEAVHVVYSSEAGVCRTCAKSCKHTRTHAHARLELNLREAVAARAASRCAEKHRMHDFSDLRVREACDFVID